MHRFEPPAGEAYDRTRNTRVRAYALPVRTHSMHEHARVFSSNWNFLCPPSSMDSPLPHVLTLQAPRPLQPQTASPGLHLLLPSRRFPPICPTLQAPPFPQPQASSSGWHLISPLQCPQVRNPGGRGRGPVRASARACVRVSVRTCGRSGWRARERTRYPRAARARVCVCGGDMFAGLRPQPRCAGATPAPASTVRAPSTAVRAAGRRSNRDGFKQAVPI